MERFGLRQVVSAGLLLIAVGAGLSGLAQPAWQLVLTWGVLIGPSTGSMALIFAATVANAWFVKRRGLVVGSSPLAARPVSWCSCWRWPSWWS
jgi:hypothetical protein